MNNSVFTLCTPVFQLINPTTKPIESQHIFPRIHLVKNIPVICILKIKAFVQAPYKSGYSIEIPVCLINNSIRDPAIYIRTEMNALHQVLAYSTFIDSLGVSTNNLVLKQHNSNKNSFE